MASTLTITDLLTDFGAYYLQSGQNAQRLIRDITAPTETLNIPGIRHINTKETIYQMANPEFGEVLQPFQKGFTSKGDTEFHPNEIRLRQLKVDYELFPGDIEDSWLGFLAGDSSRNRENWPIIRYIMEELIAPQIAEDKELNIAYKGVYSAPTSGTAGNASACMNGLRKLIRDAASADYPCQEIESIGPLDADTAFEQIEEFAAAIGHKYLSSRFPIHLFCAPEFVLAYLKQKRENNYYTIQQDTQLSTRIDFTNITLHGVGSMIGTNDIWGTIPQNIIHLTKRNDSVGNFEFQKADRKVKLLMDWWEGLGFGCNKLVFASDYTIDPSSDSSSTETPGSNG